MTPTSFAFTLTMPGDERFVGAIRLLAAQAASYAQLPADAGEALAGQVQQATEAAIAATGSAAAPIEFTFSGDDARVTVEIGCTDGSRRTCTMQRPTAA